MRISTEQRDEKSSPHTTIRTSIARRPETAIQCGSVKVDVCVVSDAKTTLCDEAEQGFQQSAFTI